MTESGEYALGILDGFLHRHLDDLPAGEAVALLDFDVDGEDHVIGLLDVGRAQFVFDAHRALRLDLDLVPQRMPGLLELLSGHVGMSDAGRTRGYCNNL